MTSGELAREMDRVAVMTRLLEGMLGRFGTIESRISRLESGSGSTAQPLPVWTDDTKGSPDGHLGHG